MDNELKKSIPAWQLLLYFLMMTLTFIVTKKSGLAYAATRGIQIIECMFFGVLLMTNLKQGFRLEKYNIIINAWWLFYTILAYMDISHLVGLTPIFRWLNIIIFLLLGSCYWKYNFQDSLKYISYAFSFLIYLNAILLILYPDGLWIDTEWIGGGNATRYLFGNYNQMGFVCLLGITVQALYTFSTRKGKFNLFLLTIISIASVIFVGSMTSAVGLILFGIYMVFNKIVRYPKFFLGFFIVCYIMFFIFIIWHGNSIEEVSLATKFIEGTLSKDTSFSSRTEIWENAVEMIKESPWIGYGIQDVEWNDMYIGAAGPHNIWLMLLLHGGIALCFGFISITYFVVKHTLKTPSTITTLSIISICILLLMSLFEAYNIAQIFLLLQLIYYSPYLIHENDSEISLQKQAS